MSKIEFCTKSIQDTEEFVFSTFQAKKDIAVLCDGKLADKLLKAYDIKSFNSKFVVQTQPNQDYIVTKCYNGILCEPALDRNGQYKSIDGMMYIIIVGEESQLNSDYEFVQAWIINRK